MRVGFIHYFRCDKDYFLVEMSDFANKAALSSDENVVRDSSHSP